MREFFQRKSCTFGALNLKIENRLRFSSLSLNNSKIEDQKWNSYVDEWYKKEVVEVTYSQSFYKDIVVTVECR